MSTINRMSGLAGVKKVLDGDNKDIELAFAAPKHSDLSVLFGLDNGNGNEHYRGLVHFLAGYNLKVSPDNVSDSLLMAIRKGWPYLLAVTRSENGEFSWSLTPVVKPSNADGSWQSMLVED